jgi:hypothetical protein
MQDQQAFKTEEELDYSVFVNDFMGLMIKNKLINNKNK